MQHLVRSGADLKAKNASGRTPREEAEVVALRCDNNELKQTVAFLTGQEDQVQEDLEQSSKAEQDDNWSISSGEGGGENH